MSRIAILFVQVANDENQVAKASQDPLNIHGSPVIRVRTKKTKEAFDENQVAKALRDPLNIHGGPMTSARIEKMKEALMD